MDNKSATKEFNLPAYINIPLFIFQDDRLEKSPSLIAGFFYSLHTAGKNITASTDYLCALARCTKRQLSRNLNLLEELKYIKRTGFTNKRVIEWIYQVSSKIIITEDEPNSALQCTNSENKDIDCSKLGTSTSLNYGRGCPTNNKEDNKDLNPPPLKGSEKATPSQTTKPKLTKQIREEYFDRWNEIALAQGLKPINVNRESDTKPAIRAIKGLLDYWEELNSDPNYQIKSETKMTPDYFYKILTALITLKWFMLVNPLRPFTITHILRRKNFEDALLSIKKGMKQ